METKNAHRLLSLPSSLIFPLTFVGSIGPLPAALLLTATIAGKGGMRAFFRQLFIWRVNPWWYLVVLFEPALVTFIAMGQHFFWEGPLSISSILQWSSGPLFLFPRASIPGF